MKMKTDRVVRRLGVLRQQGLQPVLEYVVNLPSEIGRLVIDSLTAPERSALEQLRKLRDERRRARAILRERQRTAGQEAAAAAREGELEAFIRRLTVECATGDVARTAAASRYTQRELAPLLTPIEREACKSYRRDEILTSKACELLQCSITELNRWAADGRLSVFRSREIQGLPKKVIGRTFIRTDIERAAPHLEIWRKQDSIRKAYRRRGLRAV
jgi:hypothetical protein